MTKDKAIDVFEGLDELEAISLFYQRGGKADGLSIHRIKEASRMAIAALRAQADTPPNDPLTLEEMREMDGEPVWLHTFSAVQKKTQISCWAILECSSNANAVFLRAGVNSRLTKWFCNYGQRWLAYRRKLEEEQLALHEALSSRQATP